MNLLLTSKEIIIKKGKHSIVIPLENIEKLLYVKFSIKNYVFWEYVIVNKRSEKN